MIESTLEFVERVLNLAVLGISVSKKRVALGDRTHAPTMTTSPQALIGWPIRFPGWGSDLIYPKRTDARGGGNETRTVQ